jgi:hypothetical protein
MRARRRHAALVLLPSPMQTDEAFIGTRGAMLTAVVLVCVVLLLFGHHLVDPTAPRSHTAH